MKYDQVLTGATEATEATEASEATEAAEAYLLSNVVLKKNLLHLAGDHVGVQLTGQCCHLVETRRNYQQSDDQSRPS